MRAVDGDRYLANARGQRVDRRWFAGMLSFGVLLLVCPLSCVGLAGVGMESDVAALCGFALALVMLIAGAVTGWVLIFRVAKRLGAAQNRLDADDVAGAVAEAQSGLMLAFRADFRTKAFHVLGLAAERAGDFDDATALFDRAHVALPAMAAPLRKRRATVLIEGHRALAFAALGRIEHATASLRAAEAGTQGGKGAVDLLLDDGDWGLGSISMNSVLMGIERRKDPEAYLQLVRALLARQRGEPRVALDLLHADHARLAAGLTPHERELATRLEAECRGRLDPAYRAPTPPPADTPAARWAARVLG